MKGTCGNIINAMGIDSSRYDDYAKERLKIRKMKLDADAKEAELVQNTGLTTISE